MRKARLGLFRWVGGQTAGQSALGGDDVDIAIACIHDSETDTYSSYLESELPKLWPILERTDMLIGYNSNHFDIPLLAEEFFRAGIDFDLKGRRFVDIQNIFHKMEPRNLRAAYKFYCGKDLINAHSAEADTMATYEVLLAQLERYQDVAINDRNGKAYYPVANDIKALSEFSHASRNVDLIGHIVYNEKDVEVFNFGKHKGKAVDQVFRDEPSYYDWIMKSEFPLSTKKVVTVIKLRGFNKDSVKLDLF